MRSVVKNLAAKDREIEFKIDLGLMRKPPHIPKSEKKKVNFPNKIIWQQSTHNPTIFYIPLIDVTRDMMKDYMRWWANKYNGKLTVLKHGEKYELITDMDFIQIYHDDKFWYAEINERIRGDDE